MTASVPEDGLAQAFEAQRGRLESVAYRMLGSRADAEDAAQEAWLRLARQDATAIDNLAGWLTTVVGRVCIDVLRSRSTRPEASLDQLPSLVVTEDSDETPEDDLLLADSVGLALLTVLGTLSPAERLAFVLHDMFAVPFDEIGHIIDRSTDASKMIASRARKKVQATPQSGDQREQRAVVDAFLAAARTGDFDGLLQVLAPDVTWRVHTAHGLVIRQGAAEVAGTARHGGRAKVTARRVLVNGESGILAWRANGSPWSLMACTVIDGRIVELLSVTDPARLAAMDLPEL